MPSNHLIFYCSLLLLPSVFPSIKIFSNESAFLIRRPKYWSFSTSPSNEYSGLISFRIDWLDLLAVQGSLKSLLKDHSLKILILFLWAFFVIQLSHLYMTTGNTIALTIWTFVNKWCLSFFKCCLDLSLEKTVAPYSSILAWKIPWIEEPGRLQSMGLRRVGHDWATSLSLFTFMHWRRKWQPTPVFLPGESQGWGSLAAAI